MPGHSEGSEAVETVLDGRKVHVRAAMTTTMSTIATRATHRHRGEGSLPSGKSSKPTVIARKSAAGAARLKVISGTAAAACICAIKSATGMSGSGEMSSAAAEANQERVASLITVNPANPAAAARVHTPALRGWPGRTIQAKAPKPTAMVPNWNKLSSNSSSDWSKAMIKMIPATVETTEKSPTARPIRTREPSENFIRPSSGSDRPPPAPYGPLPARDPARLRQADRLTRPMSAR